MQAGQSHPKPPKARGLGVKPLSFRSLPYSGAVYASQNAMPKVIYKADGTKPGFITAYYHP